MDNRNIKNPWKAIPLSDYENHMQLDSVMQLQAMNRMMKRQFCSCAAKSAMVLGVAGGNACLRGAGISSSPRSYCRFPTLCGSPYGYANFSDLIFARNNRTRTIKTTLQRRSDPFCNQALAKQRNP